MHPGFLTLGIGVIIATLAAAPAPAVAMEKVQLSPFIVRTVSFDGKKRGVRPITVILTVADKKTAIFVCKFAPRLRDVLVRKFSKKSMVQQERGDIDLQGVGESLHSIVVKTLKTVVVNRVEVVNGAPKVPLGQAREIVRRGCIVIKREK